MFWGSFAKIKRSFYLNNQTISKNKANFCNIKNKIKLAFLESSNLFMQRNALLMYGYTFIGRGSK